MKKLYLPIAWGLAIIGIFALSSSFSDKSVHFFGMAGEREQIISFQYPVEVVKTIAMEGSEVGQGDQILIVRRDELDTELSSINQGIRKSLLQKQETKNTINSQLAKLKAKKQAVIADMDYQIHANERRYKTNLGILNSISDKQIKLGGKSGNTELEDLKRKRHFSVKAIEAEIDGLLTELNSASRPIDARINELQAQKEDLQRQNVRLSVKAKFDGRIGSLHFKAGELVPPFQPIMSVHSGTPRYIKGYINENISNDVKVGQAVWVNSIASNKDKKTLHGTVESLGNRIVEYPERLKKNPLVPAWGREVVVQLSNPENLLLFGEKVQVLLENPDKSATELSFLGVFNMISKANASENKDAGKVDINNITSKNSNIKAKKIEASAVLWNADAQHYLLINDEEKKDKAGVYIMTEEGEIVDKVSIKGIGKKGIDDLESISFDDGNFYILSSLSYNKKGNLKSKRRKFVRFKYSGTKATEQKKVDLYEVLDEIKDAKTTGTQLADFLETAIDSESMDVESHFVKDNNLYLGFKSPLLNGKALIIKISDVNSLFSGEIPQAHIWQTIGFSDPETGAQMHLSDMTLVDGQLFLLSVIDSGMKKSVLWHYHAMENELQPLHQFLGLKAEGLSYQEEKSRFMIVFDEGGDSKSKYSLFPYSISMAK